MCRHVCIWPSGLQPQFIKAAGILRRLGRLQRCSLRRVVRKVGHAARDRGLSSRRNEQAHPHPIQKTAIQYRNRPERSLVHATCSCH
jgi:hypothetical protein